MKLHNLTFTIEVEAGDTAPSGTVEEQAVQMWNAVKAIPLVDLQVQEMTYDTELGVTQPKFTIKAKGIPTA